MLWIFLLLLLLNLTYSFLPFCPFERSICSFLRLIHVQRESHESWTMRFEKLPLTTARTNWNSWMENQMRTQLKQTFVHKKLFFRGYLSVTGFKKVSDKNCFAFIALIVASRKQFISRQALQHYFQCRLADQHLIPRPNNATFPHFTQKPEVNNSHVLLQKL